MLPVLGKCEEWSTSEKLAVKLLTEDQYREQADAASANLRPGGAPPGLPQPRLPILAGGLQAPGAKSEPWLAACCSRLTGILEG